MKKFLSCILVVAVLVATNIFAMISVSAQSSSDTQSEENKLQKKQDQLKKDQNHLHKDHKAAESEMNQNIHKQKELEEELNKIDKNLLETETNIEEKENAIQKKNKEIDKIQEKVKQLEQDIQELNKKIEKREKLLKNRLISIQKSGGNMRFIEVVLGSESFSDFITRALAVNTIMDQDHMIMEEQSADKLSLEKKQHQLEEQKDTLEQQTKALKDQKEELKKLQAQLDQDMETKEKLMKQLKTEYEQLEEHKMSLEEEQKTLKDQERIIQKEKNKLNQLGREDNQQTSGGNGIFNWPTTGRISSPYGYRSFNGGSFHYGLDIAAPQGTRVSAAASGVVTRASYSSSYGNVVYIYHPELNKSTVYAHMHKIHVSNGAQIESGQQVGTVGNTGNSFGNHLHFEVHNGSWSSGGGINPIKFLK